MEAPLAVFCIAAAAMPLPRLRIWVMPCKPASVLFTLYTSLWSCAYVVCQLQCTHRVLLFCLSKCDLVWNNGVVQSISEKQLCDCRDDLEQARILADQVQHREKLRKRAMLSWQQNMRQLAGRAIALDKQKAGSAPPGTSKAQPASVKKALSSFEELAESEDGMRAKFEHDMALSLQLTGSVAEEASKLQHVKIIRAEPSQPTLASDSAALGPSRSHSADDSAGDTPAAAAGLTDATTAGSLHSSPQQGLLQSPPRMTRSMPAQMPDANRTDPAVDHSAREANQSPEGSARYASPRLTRSMQSQLKDSEPEAAALNSAGKTPAAPRSDGKTPAPTEGSQLRSRGGSLQLTSPRLKSLQDPLRDPEHLPAATEGSHLQSPGGSLQLTSPRLTRAMQAQLANANNLPALVSRSTGGEEPRAAGQFELLHTRGSNKHVPT